MQFRSLFPLFFLLSLAVGDGDLYASDPNIYELTSSNFDKVVHNSNYTSIVKFYAPWCGYCKQLSPIYKKLGKYFQKDSQYAVNVVAVNCDKEYNKPLCSKHRVSGFPTLMVFRPPKYNPKKPKDRGIHAMETYTGDRSLKPLVNFVSSRIKNYVKKFLSPADVGFRSWLADEGRNKVVLFTEASSIHNMYKSVAIDFMDSTDFAMVSVKSKDALAAELSDLIDGDLRPKLPMLFTLKSGKLAHFDTDKLDSKTSISEWLVETHGRSPAEGILAKKAKKYAKYRGDKLKVKRTEHDEL